MFKVGDIIKSWKAEGVVTNNYGDFVYYVKKDGTCGGFLKEDHVTDWRVIGHTNRIIFEAPEGVWW